MIHIVLHISRTLSFLSYPWAIVGGANLLLRGCISSTRDIDIITTSHGVFSIASLFKSETHRAPSWKESNNIKSTFFVANIDGIMLEVMGDPCNHIASEWVANCSWMESIEFIEFYGTIVPVTTLAYENLINTALRNLNRVEAIQKCITSQMNTSKTRVRDCG